MSSIEAGGKRLPWMVLTDRPGQEPQYFSDQRKGGVPWQEQMITQQELTSNVCVMAMGFIGFCHKVLQFLFSKSDDESIQVCITYFSLIM